MYNNNSVHNTIVPGVKLTKDEGEVQVDKIHYKQIVSSLMYLTTIHPDMMFEGEEDELMVYSDSDYAGDLDDRKSTSVKFIVAASCAYQVVWLKRMLRKVGQNQDKSIIIHRDNSSAIKLSKNHVMHRQNKQLMFVSISFVILLRLLRGLLRACVDTDIN
ncbi:hypothetical protein HRI_003334300 [Hibiscus trionum]|uniref:Reverse transcriptase Ty1/copia-type domain-containing protein n=1 Tax=Hibiscus trionum TaxID=183268 RepID=A0A9W7MFY4_HIBTR|nr:hypothetical protein HRI_003334300 [Hibiscus trionum]